MRNKLFGLSFALNFILVFGLWGSISMATRFKADVANAIQDREAAERLALKLGEKAKDLDRQLRECDEAFGILLNRRDAELKAVLERPPPPESPVVHSINPYTRLQQRPIAGQRLPCGCGNANR